MLPSDGVSLQLENLSHKNIGVILSKTGLVEENVIAEAAKLGQLRNAYVHGNRDIEESVQKADAETALNHLKIIVDETVSIYKVYESHA
jgi:uncharacterized protein YutE (UPF0331/DUF86 family)